MHAHYSAHVVTISDFQESVNSSHSVGFNNQIQVISLGDRQAPLSAEPPHWPSPMF